MLKYDDSSRKERYWLASERLSDSGVNRLKHYIKNFSTRNGSSTNIQSDDLVNEIVELDVTEFLVIFTMYAFADIPIDTPIECAFSLIGETGTVALNLRSAYIVNHLGFPVKMADHGHKHYLFLKGSKTDFAALRTLPERNSLDEIQGKPLMGLAMAIDIPFISKVVKI